MNRERLLDEELGRLVSEEAVPGSKHLLAEASNREGAIGEGIGGDVEAVRGDAVFKAFQKQVNAGRKQGDLERSRKDPDGIDDLVDWFNENAAEEIDAAIRSLKVLGHYAGTGILGFDNRTRRAAADLTAELNAVFYRIGQLAGLQKKKA
jgi:hypothetical protein